jgi:hypothetical protein
MCFEGWHSLESTPFSILFQDQVEVRRWCAHIKSAGYRHRAALAPILAREKIIIAHHMLGTTFYQKTNKLCTKDKAGYVLKSLGGSNY